MTEAISITIEQLDNMKHAIGYRREKVKKNGKYEAYRNYYFTPTPDESWQDLVNKGYAIRGIVCNANTYTPMFCYSVSAKGKYLLECLLDIKIVDV